MAYGLPDNLWIGLLVMAVIILALLWKDKISKSSGGGGKTKTTPDGPEFNSIEHRPVNPDPGQEVNFKADYTANASIKKYWFKVDGKKRDTTITGGSLKTGPLTFDEGSYSYKAYVKDENGKDSSIGSSFSVNSGRTLEGPKLKVKEEWGDDLVVLVAKAKPRSADSISLTEISVEGVGQSENNGPEARIEVPANPGQTYSYTAETLDSNDLTAEVEGEITIPRNPSSLAVTANYEIINEVGGNVRIWSEVTEYSNEITETSIHFRPEGASEDDWVSEVAKGDIRAEIPQENRENLRDGVYEVRAHAEDVESNEATDTATFRLGNGGGSDGPEGDYPELVRIINQSSSNSLGDLGGFRGDEEVMTLLEQILEKVDGFGGDIRGPGMDAYQLLFALNSLGVDLDGGDNQQIVDELRMIRQQMDSGGMSQDELENALKNVLNDVFGQDLQSVIQGLDLGNGFDEDKIVQAIRDNQLDIDPLAKRLSNIEQTISQVQTQGRGDLSDLERKLDKIEAAIKDTQIDQSMMQQFMTHIQNMESEGVDVDLDAGGMDQAAILRLMGDIQDSGDPDKEMESILQATREQGRLNRDLIKMLIKQEEEGHRRGVVNPIYINGLDVSGELSNKNHNIHIETMGQDPEIQQVERRMDDDIKDEIENLEEEYQQIKTMVDRQGDIGDAEQILQEDIQDIVKHLKKARQYEKELADFVGGKKKGTTTAENLEHGVSEIKGHIDAANRAVSNFKDDFQDVKKRFQDQRRLVEQTDYFEDRLEEQEEGLEKLEELLERAIKGFEESEIDGEHYNQA